MCGPFQHFLDRLGGRPQRSEGQIKCDSYFSDGSKYLYYSDYFRPHPTGKERVSMATADDHFVDSGSAAESNPPPPQRLHRIATVRRQQGVSIRSATRQLGCDTATTRRQESESTDLKISELFAWQKLLDVPLSDLLVDPVEQLSAPILERARLVRLMKTASAIKEQAKQKDVQRLAVMLANQLTEIMPELAEVSPWHSVGQRRSLNELGQVVERRLSDDFFHQS